MMKKHGDTWCAPLFRGNDSPLYGGAARNVRIARMGGMDEIIEEVARNVLQKANERSAASRKYGNVISIRQRAA